MHGPRSSGPLRRSPFTAPCRNNPSVALSFWRGGFPWDSSVTSSILTYPLIIWYLTREPATGLRVQEEASEGTPLHCHMRNG